MTHPPPVSAAIPLARGTLSALRVLTVLAALAILGLLLASLAAPAFVFDGLGVRPAPDRARLERGMRLVMLLGLASAPLAFLALTRLREIVDTVRAGDPFVRANAGRLGIIARALLGLELLRLAVGLAASRASTAAQQLELGRPFALTPWLAVLLLLVLARVFEEGARLRADLEGTV